MGPKWSLHTVLSAWTFSPFALCVAALLVLAGSVYLRDEWAMAAAGIRWSSWRMASYFSGLVAVDLALQSPVSALTMTYFQAHVVQHVLLMVVAPPLLAMGAPITLHMNRGRLNGASLQRVVRSRPARVICHPVPVWFLYYFSMFAFFLTSALDYSMRHMWVMDAVNVAFLLTSLLFWWPLVGADPGFAPSMTPGARAINLLIGIPVESFLALALLSDPRPAAAWYPMSSTRSGALWLWAATVFLTVAALVPVTVQWMGERRRRGPTYGPAFIYGSEDLAMAGRVLEEVS
jgi:putative copper resistance protein D